MNTLVAGAIVWAVMLLSLAGVPACAARMEGGEEKMTEKGAATEKSGSITKQQQTEMMETTGAMTEKRGPGNMRMAKLMGADDHHASGTVVLITDQHGDAILQFKDILVDRVPDGRVYLAKNGDHRNGVEISKLTQFLGTVTLPIPAGIKNEAYDSVVIWCKKFDVEIGHAFFGRRKEQ